MHTETAAVKGLPLFSKRVFWLLAISSVMVPGIQLAYLRQELQLRLDNLETSVGIVRCRLPVKAVLPTLFKQCGTYG